MNDNITAKGPSGFDFEITSDGLNALKDVRYLMLLKKIDSDEATDQEVLGFVTWISEKFLGEEQANRYFDYLTEKYGAATIDIFMRDFAAVNQQLAVLKKK